MNLVLFHIREISPFLTCFCFNDEIYSNGWVFQSLLTTYYCPVRTIISIWCIYYKSTLFQFRKE